MVSPGCPTRPCILPLLLWLSSHIGPQSGAPGLPLGPVTELVSCDLPLLLSVSTADVGFLRQEKALDSRATPYSWQAETDRSFQFWVTRQSRAVCANGLAELYCPSSPELLSFIAFPPDFSFPSSFSPPPITKFTGARAGGQ